MGFAHFIFSSQLHYPGCRSQFPSRARAPRLTSKPARSATAHRPSSTPSVFPTCVVPDSHQTFKAARAPYCNSVLLRNTEGGCGDRVIVTVVVCHIFSVLTADAGGPNRFFDGSGAVGVNQSVTHQNRNSKILQSHNNHFEFF